jgi:hypothetical protein
MNGKENRERRKWNIDEDRKRPKGQEKVDHYMGMIKKQREARNEEKSNKRKVE